MATPICERLTRAWLTKTKLLASAIITAMLVPGLFAYPAPENDALGAPLRGFLEKEIGLTEMQMQSVIAARPVAKFLKTKTKDEVAIFGIVRIRAPQEMFIEKFRDIVTFENAKGVSMGRFQSPPVLSDVAALQIDNKELKEISNCRPGDCTIQLSDRAMQSLREQIDWNSPKATSQAQSVIRRAFVDYVANYQKIGDEALAVYNDKGKPQAIRDRLRQLMQNSSHFIQHDPQLANYLAKYPQERPPDTEDILYWQKGEFGLKPVVRASHLVIHRNQHERSVTYAIASKMLFASHYFGAALELKSVVPDTTSPDSKSFYLVCLNRSFVDGLTGFRGALIRGTVLKKSRQSLADYLAGVKQKLESAYSREVK
jgi:hypothetical protein